MSGREGELKNMSQALVQTGAEISISGGTSGSVTLNGVGAGNLLTAQCLNDTNATATFTVSDNNGNSWTTDVSKGDGGVAGSAAIAHAANVHAGNTAVTVTASASIGFKARISEWSGSDTSSPLATTDNDVVTSTTHDESASGISPGAACIVLVCACGISSLTSPTAGSGYTSQSSASVFDFYEYQIFGSTPTSEKGLWTTSSSIRTVGVMAAFKAAPAGGATAGAFIGGGVGSLIGA